jgi:hypothetical protein
MTASADPLLSAQTPRCWGTAGIHRPVFQEGPAVREEGDQ